MSDGIHPDLLTERFGEPDTDHAGLLRQVQAEQCECPPAAPPARPGRWERHELLVSRRTALARALSGPAPGAGS